MNDRKKCALLLAFLLLCFAFVLSAAGEAPGNSFDEQAKYIGITIDELDDAAAIPFHPEIPSWFENWYGPVAYNKLALCASAEDITPLITWQPQNVLLQEIADGVHDAYNIGYLQNLSSQLPDKEILIRFAHEMEIRPKYAFSWYTWQAERNPEAYVAAWRHVVELGRSIDPNIRFVWSPNRADQYADIFYPGNDYVDYVGITMNLRFEFPDFDTYTTFQQFYESVGQREHLESYGKPIIISEIGYSNPDEKITKSYIRSIFDYFLQDPMISAVIFFNYNADKGREYKITDNAQLLAEVADGAERLQMIRDQRITD